MSAAGERIERMTYARDLARPTGYTGRVPYRRRRLGLQVAGVEPNAHPAVLVPGPPAVGPGEHAETWSVWNVKAYGGNVAEKSFLQLADLIRHHSYTNVSLSSGMSGSSHSHQEAKDRIFDVSSVLVELNSGRAAVLASGDSTLVRKTRC